MKVFFFREGILQFQEFLWDISIVHRRAEMMYRMVIIIPARFIIWCIDALIALVKLSSGSLAQ